MTWTNGELCITYSSNRDEDLNKQASQCMFDIFILHLQEILSTFLPHQHRHTHKKTFNLLNAKLCTKHSRETCKYTVLVTKKDALLNLLWGLHTQTRWLEKYEVYNKKQHHFTAIGSIKISGIWCLLNAAHIESRISLPITG